jgi:hypothetical protein
MEEECVVRKRPLLLQPSLKIHLIDEDMLHLYLYMSFNVKQDYSFRNNIKKN